MKRLRVQSLEVSGLVLGVWSLEFSDSGIGVWSLIMGFRAEDLGFGPGVSGFRVKHEPAQLRPGSRHAPSPLNT